MANGNVTRFVKLQLACCVARFWRGSDRAARENGWVTVEARPGKRVYRDPRFDRLRDTIEPAGAER
jgi:hypothetical protein